MFVDKSQVYVCMYVDIPVIQNRRRRSVVTEEGEKECREGGGEGLVEKGGGGVVKVEEGEELEGKREVKEGGKEGEGEV